MSNFFQFMSRCVAVFLCLFLLCLHRDAYADASSATLYVSVSDPSGAVVTGAHLLVRNTATGQEQHSESNKAGTSAFTFLRPGHYQLSVSKASFADVVVDNIVLNVGDERRLQLVLKVGMDAQNVTVDASGLTLNTTDASVSTVVDRNFVKNMPLNGRSFQDLISMTPGVVTQTPQTTAYVQSNGDFSVNGQRTESNYYTVDGVSGNTGAGVATAGGQNASTGSIPGSTALGTTQSLLSVDALQEFRVSGSTYSAEYGRSPGGQFSLISRSGTNAFHGSAFDYLRNDVFDANDWFNSYNGIRKTALRQNDFGGTAGGPITIPHLYSGKDKSFFFVSYEGLRLDQPTAATIQYVPSLAVRSNTPAVLQPLFNAFPLPTGSEIQLSGTPSGLSPFVMAYSLPSAINSTSARIDQHLTQCVSVFFRYGETPTSTTSRQLSSVLHQRQKTTTYTGGVDALLWKDMANSLRVGYARSESEQLASLDNFGGATPSNFATIMGVPGSSSTYDYYPDIYISGVGSTTIQQSNALTRTNQWNITDTIAKTIGHHQLKAGIDERRIASSLLAAQTNAILFYYSSAEMLANSATLGYVIKIRPGYPVFQEFSSFVQDDWRVAPSLSIAAGLRWEVNPAPTASDGYMPYTAYGNPAVPASLTLAPQGTALWKTSWFNIAPRLGIAWTAHSQAGHETVIRAGSGVFFDTGNQNGTAGFHGIGYIAYNPIPNATMPFASSAFAVSTDAKAPYTSGVLYVFPQHLQLPYTLQWNASIDQALGQHQTLTLSYVASAGRRLLQNQYRYVTAENPNFGDVYSFPNGVTSNYQSLQVRFQRSIAHGVQALTSYTWSHSLDYGSTNASYPLTYGNSDFDVRHNFQAGLTWDIPGSSGHGFRSAVVNNWGIDARANLRSGFPITILGNTLTDATGSQYYSGANYDPTKPIYLYGKQYPGGRIVNGGPNVSSATAAFSLPSGTTSGNAPRNFVRGFGAQQFNLALRREFHIVDRTSLQFRTETFNIFNHPSFGYIDPNLTDAQFGYATKMLNSSLGAMSSLYQQGGSRSMQFSLHVAF